MENVDKIKRGEPVRDPDKIVSAKVQLTPPSLRRQMRVDLFDFELPEERIALRPAVPRDAARLLVVDAKTNGSKTAPSATCPICCGRETRLSSTTPGSSRRGSRASACAAMRSRRSKSTLHTRENDEHMARFRASGKAAASRRPHPLRRDVRKHGVPARSARCDGARQGDGGEVTLAFDLTGPALDEAIATLGQMPLPPYIASRRATDAQDRTRLPDDVCRRERRGCGADRRPALHAGTVRGARRARHHAASASRCMSVPARSCRSRRTIRAITACMRNGGLCRPQTADALNAARTSGGRIIAVGTTALRLLEIRRRRERHPSRRSQARLRSSSRPAIASARSMRWSPIFTCRARRCSCWSRLLPGSNLMKRAYAHAIEKDIASIPTATRVFCCDERGLFFSGERE